MVAVAAFRGLRFDPAVTGDLGLVLTPPFDVITPALRGEYERQSRHNVIRLAPGRGGQGDLPDDPGRYDRAAKLLAAWREEGALQPDPEPSLYLYEEVYTVRGERRVQRGVLACVELDGSGRWILPHEGTMAPLVAERLRLLEATRANLSPVFGLYAGGGRTAGVLDRVAADPPAIDATDPTGIGHRVWPVTDPAVIAAWRALLAPEQVLIADGHHRWRAALAYRDAMRRAHPDPDRASGAAPWEWMLAYLVDADAAGPAILANHRLLKGVPGDAVLAALAADFDAVPRGSAAEIEEGLAGLPREAVAFGLYAAGQSWLLIARDPAAVAAETGLERWPLDVEVLHGPVLARRLGIHDIGGQDLAYGADLARIAERVDRNGGCNSLLALRPARFREVLAIARTGKTLPPKTTFFHPKPRDGLVLRPLEPEPQPWPPGRR